MRTILITGGSGGIGYAVAEALAGPDTTVVIAGRDPVRLAAARDRLSAKGVVEQVRADLSVQAEVRRLAAAVADRHPKLDVLINNAGVTLPDRQVTADGLEMTFAVNHLAPYLLTALLLPQLQAAGGARVIGVTSSAARAGRIDFDDLQGERRYGQHRAYNQSKLANVLFAQELGRRTGDTISALAVAPGFVRTSMTPPFPFSLLGFLRTSPERAARRIVAADRSTVVKGRKGDPAIARRLWEVSAELTKGG